MAILSKTLEKRVQELERRLNTDELRLNIRLRFVGSEPRPRGADIRSHDAAGDLAVRPATFKRTMTVSTATSALKI